MLKGELSINLGDWYTTMYVKYSEMTSKAFWEEAHNHVTLLLDDYHAILGKSA